MTEPTEYEPSPAPFVRDQVAAIEASGGTDAATFGYALAAYADYQTRTTRVIPVFLLEPMP